MGDVVSSMLRLRKIISIGKKNQNVMPSWIHHGCKFLSENADFARLVKQMGLSLLVQNQNILNFLVTKWHQKKKKSSSSWGTDEPIIDIEEVQES